MSASITQENVYKNVYTLKKSVWLLCLHEVAADGEVVEAPTEPGQQDAGEWQGYGDWPDIVHPGDGH